MTTVQTWIQDQFLRPNQTLHRRPGDFLAIDELLPTLDGTRLERSPTFGADHITFPANFDTPGAMFYDQANDNIVVVGVGDAIPPSDLVGQFYIAHSDFSKSSLYSTTSSPTAIGGAHKRNVLYVQNGFWFVGDDGDVYLTCDPYGQAASNKYASGDAYALVCARDTIYLITTSDEILRWNTSSGTFETFYDTWLQIGGEFLCHYRNDFILVAYENDGACILYRIDDLPPAELREVARLHPHTAALLPDDAGAQWATPWALYHDDLYFSPGAWISPDDGFEQLPIYRYTGSRVELVDTIDGDVTPHAWGLTEWRDRLLFYLLDDGDQRIYVLHNDRFVKFLDTAYTMPAESDLYSVGGELAMITTAGGSDGVQLTRYKAATATFTSSWLDMGHLASQKHLSRLAAIVDNPLADFKVKIEYRTEAGSWKEAVEQANARYISAGNLGVTFYLLQIRVTFTDEISPPTYPQVRLESLAATYGYGVR
jgi:hypothetical protein